MPKVNNIASTAHSQYAEQKALLGTPASSAELQSELTATTNCLTELSAKHDEALAQIESLTAELAAEKEAHAATQAALTAATATTSTPAA